MFTRVVLAATLAALAAGPATANARKFTYTYESAALPKGAHEVEFWTTWRAGRSDVYSRLENRLEYELGVTDRLLTAIYVNWKKVSERDPLTGDLGSESEFSGVSSEWKLKLLDPAADVLGLAGYLEGSADSDETELEAKLILDKSFGPILVAYNGIAEAEWHWLPNAFVNDERIMEHVAGLSIAPAAGFAFGGESRIRSVYIDGVYEVGAAFAGPTLHWARGEFWITATCLFQVSALKTIPEGEALELNDHERMNARVLVSLPL